jgi:hypothetical protein
MIIVERAPANYERQALDLERLIGQQVQGRYALFFNVGEGTVFPDGTEDESGYVLDEWGRVFSFWTGWDAGRGTVTLEEWKQVEVEPHWEKIGEYRRAREQLGMDAKLARRG